MARSQTQLFEGKVTWFRGMMYVNFRRHWGYQENRSAGVPGIGISVLVLGFVYFYTCGHRWQVCLVCEHLLCVLLTLTRDVGGHGHRWGQHLHVSLYVVLLRTWWSPEFLVPQLHFFLWFVSIVFAYLPSIGWWHFCKDNLWNWLAMDGNCLILMRLVIRGNSVATSAFRHLRHQRVVLATIWK